MHFYQTMETNIKVFYSFKCFELFNCAEYCKPKDYPPQSQIVLLKSVYHQYSCMFVFCYFLLVIIAYWLDSLSKTQFVRSHHSNCPWKIGVKRLTNFTNTNKSSLILILFTVYGLGPNVSSLPALVGFSLHTLCIWNWTLELFQSFWDMPSVLNWI